MNTIRIFISAFLVFNFAFESLGSVEIGGSLRLIHKGYNGEIYKGAIKIYNNDKFDQDVRIYQTDLIYNYKGEINYNQKVSHSRSNLKWMTYSPKTITLKGGETNYIEFEMSIPISDTLKGTYWSVLMVEGLNDADPKQKGQMTLNTYTRFAIQIITELPDTEKALLVFLDPTLQFENGKPYLAVDIINKCSRYIIPEVSLEIVNEREESVMILDAEKKGLLPTTSYRYKFDLGELERGKTYKTIIVAAVPGADAFGLKYALKLKN